MLLLSPTHTEDARFLFPFEIGGHALNIFMDLSRQTRGGKLHIRTRCKQIYSPKNQEFGGLQVHLSPALGFLLKRSFD